MPFHSTHLIIQDFIKRTQKGFKREQEQEQISRTKGTKESFCGLSHNRGEEINQQSLWAAPVHTTELQVPKFIGPLNPPPLQQQRQQGSKSAEPGCFLTMQSVF